MITRDTKQCNIKSSSRAEYFREYRKRLKNEKRAGGVPSPLSSGEKLNGWPFLAILGLVLTGYLIFLSTQILPGSFFERIFTATLTEVLLVALAIMKPENQIEKVGRGALLFAFLVYSSLPFVSEPFAKANSLIEQEQILNATVAATNAQVAQLTQNYNELVARDRISQSQRVANELQQAQALLRNNLAQLAQAKETKAQQSKVPPIAVALQRLLFLFGNLLVAHRVAQHPFRTDSELDVQGRQGTILQAC